MKIHILSLWLFLALLSSCSDFLEEKSQDLIIPKTVKDYRELLFGEAYPRDHTSVHTWLDIMTDDVKENIKGSSFGSDTRVKVFGYYTWQPRVEETITGALNADNSWKTYYHSILICNVVLNEMGNIKGTWKEKEDLKAEAYALRAYCYFMLVNLYGLPYHKESAETDLGIPLNEVVGMEDKQFKRESVARIYQQIEHDLSAAISGFKESGLKKNYFRWNLPAVYLLASRVSLYKQEYDKAIAYASEVIAVHPQLYNLSLKNANDRFLNEKNPEILFTYGDYLISFYAQMAKCNFPMSDELYASYGGNNDLRIKNFFYKKGSNYLPNKNDEAGETGVYGFALRSAEAYLNRAEAYAETGQKELAMSDLKTIRENRLEVYRDLEANTQEELIRNVREERRRELCFEFHRWFDLRRWDQPEIEHTFTRDIKKPDITERYVLKKNDPAYTLPIPTSVTDYEPDMRDNMRPERPDLNPAENSGGK